MWWRTATIPRPKVLEGVRDNGTTATIEIEKTTQSAAEVGAAPVLLNGAPVSERARFADARHLPVHGSQNARR
jgi:hypothetical protein